MLEWNGSINYKKRRAPMNGSPQRSNPATPKGGIYWDEGYKPPPLLPK